MNLKAIISFVFILSAFNAFAQTNDQMIRLQVLKNDKINQEFVFKSADHSETHLTYLGTLKSKNKISYKIMNSVWIWGQSHRATTRILVFNNANRYLGNYRLTIIEDLPSCIKDNNLIFTNRSRVANCDPKTTTSINFDDGILKEFFRKCRGESGDFYSFDKE